jgi:hypothetical protein
MIPWLGRQKPPSPATPAVSAPPPASGEPPAVLLGEVAGALLTQLTLAQARADDAALHCGERYRQHPWLARFPVPSVFVESAEVDLRVAMMQRDDSGGGEGAHAGALHVLFTPVQLQEVPPELISTVRLKLRCAPKRLAEVDGQTLLLP